MLLCSDYDRTLRIDNQISNEVRKAIKLFQQAGHVFCINTGRNFHNMQEELANKQLHCDYVIAGSGSQIFDDSGNMLAGFSFGNKLSKTTADEIFKANSINIVIGEATRSVVYLRQNHDIWDSSILDIDFDAIQTISTRFPTNIEAQQFQKQLEKTCEVNAYVNRNAVDIVRKNISKATGVEALYKLLKHSREDVYVIGDGANDVSMIQAFNGYRVDNSEDILINIASRSFSDVGECIAFLMESK